MHSGDCIILNRWRYAFVFPCAVIIAVRLGVKLIFFVNLSVMYVCTCLVSLDGRVRVAGKWCDLSETGLGIGRSGCVGELGCGVL